jgi:hypothetical protein
VNRVDDRSTIRPLEFRLNADVANVRVRWGSFGECALSVGPNGPRHNPPSHQNAAAGICPADTSGVIHATTTPIWRGNGLTTDRVSPGVSCSFDPSGTCQGILSWLIVFIRSIVTNVL